jgi:hypothetical protein
MVFPQSFGTGAADRRFYVAAEAPPSEGLVEAERRNWIAKKREWGMRLPKHGSAEPLITSGSMTIDNTKSGSMKSRAITPETMQHTGNRPQ